MRCHFDRPTGFGGKGVPRRALRSIQITVAVQLEPLAAMEHVGAPLSPSNGSHGFEAEGDRQWHKGREFGTRLVQVQIDGRQWEIA